MPQPHDTIARSSGYFERAPEKLVLEGYRCWTRGYVMQSTEPWTQAQLLYRGLLGSRNGTRAIVALAGFVKTLGLCATCSLCIFDSGSRFICRDEVLVMGLIAGIQNCDEPTIEACLQRLCRPQRSGEAAMAAGGFALSLKSMGKVMRPIPAHVIARLADRSPDMEADAMTCHTIH